MLFNSEGKSYAYATSHQLSIDLDTTEVSSRDQGLVKGLIFNGYSWELSSENLFSMTDYLGMLQDMIKGTEITVLFGLKQETDKVVGNGDMDNWDIDTSNYIKGTVVITSLSVNAKSSGNATYSITFTGVSELEITKN